MRQFNEIVAAAIFVEVRFVQEQKAVLNEKIVVCEARVNN